MPQSPTVNDTSRPRAEEYSALREEILECQRQEFNILFSCLALTGTLLAFGIQRRSAILCCAPVPFLIIGATMIVAIRKSILGIAVYLHLFHEQPDDSRPPAPCWEYVLRRLRLTKKQDDEKDTFGGLWQCLSAYPGWTGKYFRSCLCTMLILYFGSLLSAWAIANGVMSGEAAPATQPAPIRSVTVALASTSHTSQVLSLLCKEYWAGFIAFIHQYPAGSFVVLTAGVPFLLALVSYPKWRLLKAIIAGAAIVLLTGAGYAGPSPFASCACFVLMAALMHRYVREVKGFSNYCNQGGWYKFLLEMQNQAPAAGDDQPVSVPCEARSFFPCARLCPIARPRRNNGFARSLSRMRVFPS